MVVVVVVVVFVVLSPSSSPPPPYSYGLSIPRIISANQTRRMTEVRRRTDYYSSLSSPLSFFFTPNIILRIFIVVSEETKVCVPHSRCIELAQDKI